MGSSTKGIGGKDKGKADSRGNARGRDGKGKSAKHRGMKANDDGDGESRAGSSSSSSRTNGGRHGKGKPGPRAPLPPVPTPGRWLLRKDFRGTKSFGAFFCSCGRKWITAHAQKKYKQGCQVCEVESLADYMWQNEVSDSDYASSGDSDSDDEAKPPHDSSRCEACRKGVCSAVKLPAFHGRRR